MDAELNCMLGSISMVGLAADAAAMSVSSDSCELLLSLAVCAFCCTKVSISRLRTGFLEITVLSFAGSFLFLLVSLPSPSNTFHVLALFGVSTGGLLWRGLDAKSELVSGVVVVDAVFCPTSASTTRELGCGAMRCFGGGKRSFKLVCFFAGVSTPAVDDFMVAEYVLMTFRASSGTVSASVVVSGPDFPFDVSCSGCMR